MADKVGRIAKDNVSPAPTASVRLPRIWVDVEDLFHYRLNNSRPSGIQRVEYELCRALASLAETSDSVRFVRHDPARNSFLVIPYNSLEELYNGMVALHGPALSLRPAKLPDRQLGLRIASWQRFARGVTKRAIYRLPGNIRAPLQQIVIHQLFSLQSVAELFRIGRVAAARRMSRYRRPIRDGMSLAEEDFRGSAAPGDVLLALGSPWFHPAYSAVVRKAQQEYGMRFAMLVYDIIPLRRPEWFERGLTNSFRACMHSVLPLVDVLMTTSHASANDVDSYAAANALILRARLQVIPIGTGFSSPPIRLTSQPAVPRPLPKPGSYALVVSTIEVRKNHILLFRVWRRLLEDLPPAEVPSLVFAGRIGWLVADLMEQLGNAGYLNGKIVLVQDPTDSELAALYRGCQFTLFPSFYEGWGLPVTESMDFGRPCIISNATSLPEAGGKLARYFDPGNSDEAYSIIRNTITDPQGLKIWQERVAGEFAPITWDRSAAAIRLMLDTTNAVDFNSTALPRV